MQQLWQRAGDAYCSCTDSADCEGLLMLLEGRLSICRQQLDAAKRQF